MDNHKWDESLLDSQENFSPFQRFRKPRRVWLKREDGTEMELESPFLFPVLAQEAERFEWDTPKPPTQLPVIPATIVETWGTETTMLEHIKKLALSALPDLAKKPTAKWTAADKKALKSISNSIRKKLVEARHKLYRNGPLPPIGTIKIPFGFKAVKRGLRTNTAYLTCPRVDTVLADLHNKGLINITQDQLDVFQRMANVETSGMITTLNSWDTAVVSIGFFQLTLHTGKLQRWIKLAPAAFKRYGIELHPTNKYIFDPTEKHPAIGNVENKDRAQLRFHGWAERFHYAGLDQEVIIAQVSFGIKYLEEQKNTLKRRLRATFKQKDDTLYNQFINDHYNKSAYVRGLFQESLNNNPARATRAVYKAMKEPDTADWLEGYKNMLIKEDLKTIVTKTVTGTSIVLSKTQPEMEYEDVYDEMEEDVTELEDAYNEMEEDVTELEDADDEMEEDATELEDADDEMEYDEGEEDELEDADEEMEEGVYDEMEYDEEEEDDPDKEMMYEEEPEHEDAEEPEYEETPEEEYEEDFEEEYETGIAAGTTNYLKVSLVKGAKLRTGMFIPTSCTPSGKIDIVVYLHGLYEHGNKPNGMELYWQHYTKLREHFSGSNKNAVLLAPGLSHNPQNTPTLLNARAGFDNFIHACFKAMKAENHIPADAEPGRIIIAAHSAGGKVMSDILKNHNQLLSQVVECWGFDCLYGYPFDAWLKKDRQKNRLYHYWAYNGYNKKSRPGINGDTLAKLHPNAKNIAPAKGVYHQGVIAHAWKNEINKRTWFDLVSANEVEENEMPSPPKAVKVPLSGTPLPIVKFNAGERLAEIKEAPAVYLKAIVNNAALGVDADKWFSNFTNFTFLGRKLKSGSYINMEMAKLLQKIEDQFIKDTRTANATLAGDALGLTKEGLSGSRQTSATADYSYHMFGLAVDIDYILNPFIQAQSAFNKFMKKVGLLITGTDIPVIRWDQQGLPMTTAQYLKLYDELHALNVYFKQYFAYLDDHTALQARLTAAESGFWKGKSLTAAIKLIQKDLKEISAAWKGTRSNPQQIFKTSGFLNQSRALVKGLVENGMDWGARYGDIMHFDMRTSGAGLKISGALSRYKAKKKAEALTKYKAEHP